MSNHHVDCAGGLRLGSATRKLVFLALCDDASRTSGLAMPGLEKVMEWAECSKSQAMAHMKWLIEHGYVECVQHGRRGTRAVYKVFAKVPCCSEHAPDLPEWEGLDFQEEKWSGPQDPKNESPKPVDNFPETELGSGPQDPKNELGSGMGPDRVRIGSGSYRTPPNPPILQASSRGESSYVTTSSEPEPVDNSPSVESEDASAPPTPSTHTGGEEILPMQCETHRGWVTPPPCRACQAARERWEEHSRLKARVCEKAARERERAERRAAEEARARRRADPEYQAKLEEIKAAARAAVGKAKR